MPSPRVRIRPFRRSLRRLGFFVRAEHGQGMVEASLALIGTFTLAFMLFEGSMLIYAYSVINDAAREGVRYAVVHGSDSTNCSGPTTGCTDQSGSNVSAVVKQYAALSFHDISGMRVEVKYPDSSAAALSLVQVKVTYTYVPFANFFSLSSKLTVTSQGRIIY